MYIPDLTILQEYTLNSRPVYHIGWLDRDYKYPTGNVPEKFLDRLWRFCNDDMFMYTMGIHKCNLGSHKIGRALEVTYKGKVMHPGSGQGYIFGKTGLFFIPDMIFHYVFDHNYRPPDQFIEAVLTAPLPSTWHHRFQRWRLWREFYKHVPPLRGTAFDDFDD